MAGGGQQAAASSLPSAQQLVKKKKIEVFFSPTETWYTGDVAKYHTRNDHNFHCHTVLYDDPLLPAECTVAAAAGTTATAGTAAAAALHPQM